MAPKKPILVPSTRTRYDRSLPTPSNVAGIVIQIKPRLAFDGRCISTLLSRFCPSVQRGWSRHQTQNPAVPGPLPLGRQRDCDRLRTVSESPVGLLVMWGGERALATFDGLAWWWWCSAASWASWTSRWSKPGGSIFITTGPVCTHHYWSRKEKADPMADAVGRKDKQR